MVRIGTSCNRRGGFDGDLLVQLAVGLGFGIFVAVPGPVIEVDARRLPGSELRFELGVQRIRKLLDRLAVFNTLDQIGVPSSVKVFLVAFGSLAGFFGEFAEINFPKNKVK